VERGRLHVEPAVGGSEVPARGARGQFRGRVPEEGVAHRERLEEPLAREGGERRPRRSPHHLGQEQVPVARVDVA
jgi:hypothetical protein